MTQYDRTTLPALYPADKITDDAVYIRYPMTIQEELDLVHLLPGLVRAAETRGRFLRGHSEVRRDVIHHLFECILDLHTGSTWEDTVPRPEPSEPEGRASRHPDQRSGRVQERVEVNAAETRQGTDAPGCARCKLRD